jgi:hypothetical protein
MLLKRGLKLLVPVAVVGFLILVFLINFSSVESRYECNGTVTNDGNSQPFTLFAKLSTFRWWVRLWSDSYGNLWIEVPSQTIEYFNHIRQVGDQLQLLDDDLKGAREMRGNFSTLSKYLSVQVPGVGFFDGSCKRISDA